MLLPPITQRQELSIGKVIVPKMGYLKIPQALRDEFGSLVNWPEPRRVSTADSDTTVFVIYEFPKLEMLKLKKEGKTGDE